ncbi:MAG: LPS export ABC transporter permease LptG, partial [Alphaproteobacteria bacterium RIFOXYD12_FULL_60_8]
MSISRVLSVYVGRNFLFWLVAVLLMLMALIFLFDVIELVRRAAGRPEADLPILLEMAFLKLPQMLHMVTPFGVMIGCMVVFQRLSKSHELAVIRAAGISVWQFLAPLIAIVLLFGVINVTVFNPVSATMFSRYERLEDEMALRQASPLTLSQSGMWLRETGEGGQQAVVHAAAVRQEDFRLKMRDVIIFVFDSDDRFLRRIEGQSGALEDGFFQLQNAWIMEQGVPSVFQESLSLSTSLTLAKIQESFASPETVSFWDLPKFIEFFEAAGFSAHSHRMQWHSLISSPFLLCAMVLLAATFTMRPNPRRGGMLWRIVGGVGAGFLLYFFSKVTFA